ncbi:MAG: hypothetical protein ACLUAR_19445 [Pilosibacter sp.]
MPTVGKSLVNPNAENEAEIKEIVEADIHESIEKFWQPASQQKRS